jgi:hypothetical protein
VRQPSDRHPDDSVGPRIAVIHGLFGHDFISRNLLRLLQESGYDDISVYSHLRPSHAVADHLARAAAARRGIVVIGFSQGGFRAMKVAAELSRRRMPTDLLVTIAAGGLGRLLPLQWGFDPRRVPSRVRCCLNVFSVGDVWGTDRGFARNIVRPSDPASRVENIVFDTDEGVTHLRLAECYPAAEVPPDVRARVLDRLLTELALLQ